MEKEINDQFILTYFYSSKTSTRINWHKTKNIPNNILYYLNNRFPDSDSIKETIMRIKYGPIEERPKCVICGNPVRWYGHKKDYLFFDTCCHKCEVINRKKNIKINVKQKYNVENVFQLEEVKNKSKETWLQHYGVDHPRKCEMVQKKYEYTSLIRYGVKNAGGSEDSIRKAKQTYLLKYGIDSPMHNPAVIEKMRNQCKEKTGYNWYSQQPSSIEKCKNTWKNKEQWEIDEIIRKRKETYYEYHGVYSPMNDDYHKLKRIYKSLEKYGYEYPQQTPEYRQKMSIICSSDEVKIKVINTKIKNNSFYKSQPEEEIYIMLCNTFGNDNVIRQYRSVQYPFNCDFYLKNINYYIEYNGTWTHGKHQFNPNDKNDLLVLDKWKLKNTKYYNEAIKTWTIRDPLKRQYALLNGLNYLECWTIKDIKQFLTKYEK